MSIHDLALGGVYRVTEGFTDYYGHVFEKGFTFTFYGLTYSAYADGHTLNCGGTRICLQGDENPELVARFSSHVEKIGQRALPFRRLMLAVSNARDSKLVEWISIALIPASFFWAVYVIVTSSPVWSLKYVGAWGVALVLGWLMLDICFRGRGGKN